MKALILFDGSRISHLSLQSACHDAYRQWHCAKGQPAQPIEALVITFEAISAANFVGSGTTRLRSQAQFFLEQALDNLESCGEFDKIGSEVIHCAPAELTQVLIDRAREWQADSIYLPLKDKIAATATPTKRTGWLSWLGLGAKSATHPQIEEMDPPETLSTSEIEITKLMEQTQCRVVLTDADGIAMKLHYVAPASSAAQNKVRKHALTPTPLPGVMGL